MHYSSTLTPNQQALLEDLLELENLCLSKYSIYASQCQDTDLKNMFFALGRTKQQHVKAINQLLGRSYQ